MEDELDFSNLGDITEGFSGSDIKEACRVAALNRVQGFVREARSLYGSHYW